MPMVSVSPVSNFEADSGDPNYLDWTVTLSEPSDQLVRIGYVISGGTAAVGSDIYGNETGLLTIDPGATAGTIRMRIDADTEEEFDEAVVLELYGVENAVLAGGAPSMRTIGWILDDDGAGAKRALFSPGATVLEGSTGITEAELDLYLSRAPTTPFDIEYATLDGSARAGSDLTATSGTFTFSAGATSASVAIDVSGDGTLEPKETVALDLDLPSEIATSSVRPLEILDDDAGDGHPVVSVSQASNFEADSGDPNYLDWIVTLSEPSDQQVRIGYAITGGTAAVGSDIYGNETGLLTIASGATAGTIRMRIDADTEEETDEAVVLELFGVDNASLAGGAPSIRTLGWILDDDGTGAKRALFSPGSTVLEGDSGTAQAAFELSLSRAATTPFNVSYATLDGSARAGSDFTATSGSLTFSEGATSGSVAVDVAGDGAVELTETVTLGLDVPSEVAKTSVGPLEILDDDAGDGHPVVSVSQASNFEADSGDPNYLDWIVTLSEPSDQQVRIGYTVTGGTAAVGSDLYGNETGTLTIASGATAGRIRMRIDADTDDEPDEAAILELFGVENASFAGGEASVRALGWVLDDDGTGPDEVIVGQPVDLVEPESGTTEFSVPVTLSRPASDAVTLSVSLSGVTGSDIDVLDDSISFEEGQQTGAVRISVAGDGEFTGGGTATLSVFSSNGAIGQFGAQTITVVDAQEELEEPTQPSAPTVGDDTLVGSDGDDEIDGLDGNDEISGGAGDDRLDGGDGNDVLDGGDDDDGLLGRSGNDTLLGGPGNDNLAAAEGDDLVIGGAGDDNLGGGPGADTLEGQDGNDTLGGGGGNDELDGGAGDDVAAAGPGDDRLEGGVGNDTMGASFGNDTVLGEEGADSLGGGTGMDSLSGGAGADSIGGGEGDDTVEGDGGDDFLAGGGRNDVIDGGAGEDRINGGEGNDTLTGGTGADVFIFRDFSADDADNITDFEDGVDELTIIGQGGFNSLEIVDGAAGAVVIVSGTTITFVGIDAESLGLEDFNFL